MSKQAASLIRTTFIFLWIGISMIAGWLEYQFYMAITFLNPMSFFREGVWRPSWSYTLTVYGILVALTMLVIWVFWRKVMYPRVPEKIKDAFN